MKSSNNQYFLPLLSAILHSKSFIDIVRETAIPQTTAFRKTKSMLNDGMIFVEKMEINSEGRKCNVYRSWLRTAYVKYELGKVSVEVEENVSVKSKGVDFRVHECWTSHLYLVEREKRGRLHFKDGNDHCESAIGFMNCIEVRNDFSYSANTYFSKITLDSVKLIL